MSLSENIIIPYCLYHRIDKNTDTHLGYIAPGVKTLENGRVKYHCPKTPENIGDDWKYVATFFVVEPSFRPIPAGMKIFYLKKRQHYPYDIQDLRLMYDPFDIRLDGLYFMTYNQPVPNTAPLYFHLLGEHVFPSFDKNPPSGAKWTTTTIPSVFVMTPDTVGNEYENIKFKCINGRCLPWKKDIPDLYNDDPHQKVLNLHDCVVYCNELVTSTGENARPVQLLNRIALSSKANQSRDLVHNTAKKIRHTSNSILAGTIFIFILSLGALLMLINKRN